jgi:uncharacterized protein
VALLTGSGQQDRDEALLGHKPFLVLADALTRAGIAVLRFDDRGVGGSSAGPEGATSSDFADDALGALAFLRAEPRVDPAFVGLLGHSEGGLIADIAAARSPDVSFVVMLAGPGLPGAKLLELQTAAVLRSSGAAEDAVAAAVKTNREIYRIVTSETDPEKARAAIRGLLTERGVPQSAQEAQVSQVLGAWFRYFLVHDPAQELAKVRVPVLAVNGGTDVQVVAGPNLEAIRAALSAAGNKDFRVVELPGLNHLMQRSATGAVSEYVKIEQTMDPAALQLVSSWITAEARKRLP